MLDDFQTLADNEVDHSDGDSQKNIIKETKYSVTSAYVNDKPGWSHKGSNNV